MDCRTRKNAFAFLDDSSDPLQKSRRKQKNLLLDLPTEVRLQIYLIVFNEEDYPCPTTVRPRKAGIYPHRTHPRKRPAGTIPPLLQTCRLTRVETIPVWVRTTELRLRIWARAPQRCFAPTGGQSEYLFHENMLGLSQQDAYDLLDCPEHLITKRNSFDFEFECVEFFQFGAPFGRRFTNENYVDRSMHFSFGFNPRDLTIEYVVLHVCGMSIWSPEGYNLQGLKRCGRPLIGDIYLDEDREFAEYGQYSTFAAWRLHKPDFDIRDLCRQFRTATQAILHKQSPGSGLARWQVSRISCALCVKVLRYMEDWPAPMTGGGRWNIRVQPTIPAWLLE